MSAVNEIRVEDDQVTLLEQAARMMSESLDRSRAATLCLVERVEDREDIRLEMPPATLRLLSQLLSLMARQKTLFLFPDDKELTTNQAAAFLGVSRPFVCKLLDQETIPSTLVGRHRRAKLKDVIEYKEQMKTARRAALDQVVEASEEAGLYDL